MPIKFFNMKQKQMAYLHKNKCSIPLSNNSKEYISPIIQILQVELQRFVAQSSLEHPVIGDDWSWN